MFVSNPMKTAICLLFPLLAATQAHAALGDPRGVWDLDSTFDGYFTHFAPLSAASLVAGNDYSFGTDPSGYTFLQTQIFTPATKRLTVTNPTGPNGGGIPTRTNQWSVVMDVKFDAISPFAGFLQLDPANAADVSFYVTSVGAIIGGGGSLAPAGTIAIGTWYRLAFTCGNNGAGGTLSVKAYLNGAPLLARTGLPFDGTSAMRSTFHLFSDNNAEVRPAKLNSFGLWGEELNAADISSLGGPQPSGILAPGLINPLAPPLTQSTVSAASPYMHGANIGWIVGRPSPEWGVVIGETACSGYAHSANCGWISFGDATPANGIRYSNTDGADHGVNHDGLGNLSGLAWGANIGWINFGLGDTGTPRPLNDPDRPRFALDTGKFSGYAHGANVGWINLSTLTTLTVAGPDTDGDGIADAWEREKFTYLMVANGSTDFDKDGISDTSEATADSDPKDPNSFLRITASQFFIHPEEFFNSWSFTFTSTPRRLYRIEESTDLGVTDTWHGGQYFQGLPGSVSGNQTFSPDPKYFLRVSAIKPLQP